MSIADLQPKSNEVDDSEPLTIAERLRELADVFDTLPEDLAICDARISVCVHRTQVKGNEQLVQLGSHLGQAGLDFEEKHFENHNITFAEASKIFDQDTEVELSTSISSMQEYGRSIGSEFLKNCGSLCHAIVTAK